MKLRRKTASDEIAGFLDRGTTLTGELQFAGQLQIHGNFHGSITTNDILVVGETAVVHADVAVGEIEIHGKVFGNIQAKKRIEISTTGRVQGDVRAPIFVIESGAVFDGRSYMLDRKDDGVSAHADPSVTERSG
jgi:cytoskeletal protein CcmA (bactofilin family)